MLVRPWDLLLPQPIWSEELPGWRMLGSFFLRILRKGARLRDAVGWLGVATSLRSGALR
jgi:hypothetical protein